MAKEGDISLVNDVLEPFRRIINSNAPSGRPSCNSAPIKLDFSDNNISIKDGNSVFQFAAKRKSSLSDLFTTPDKKLRCSSDCEVKTSVSSPWEAKRIKVDLIAAKAQITKLESRINHMHTIRKEMQILFDDEKQSLVEQHRRDEAALVELQERLQHIRNRETELKKELEDLTREKNESKYNWNKQKESFEKQIAELREKLIDGNISTNDQISEMKKDMDELTQALDASQQEVEMLKREVEILTKKNSDATVLRAQVDKIQTQLTTANLKIKELEFDREAYKDWQQHAKSAQKRLAAYPEMEREIARLKSNERMLRDAVSNKLLLEEQVHSLTSRLDALQPIKRQLHETQVKLSCAEASLSDWVEMGRARGANTPLEAGRAVDAALAGELNAMADKAQAMSRAAQLEEELATAKHECDKINNKIQEIQTIKKNQESLIQRLQKRLMLVTRERDSYRQQLDCYEKELSTTLSGEQCQGQAAILSQRVQSLEKSLENYRELVNKLEATIASNANIDSVKSTSQHNKEVLQLTHEVQKLRARCQLLESHINTDVKTEQTTKVLHLTDNPATIAHTNMVKELENAYEEIKKLKSKVHKLQTEPGLEVSSTSCGTVELNQLKQQLESSRIKLQRMKEEFTSSAQEYRDVCYMLLGYKIDRIGHKIYRLSNMYADSSDEFLTFTLRENGIEMVHTDYSSTLTELVELHLQQHQSIPIFLSALTMDLFTKTTIAQQEVADEAIDCDEEEEPEDEAYSGDADRAQHEINESDSEVLDEDEEESVGDEEMGSEEHVDSEDQSDEDEEDD